MVCSASAISVSPPFPIYPWVILCRSITGVCIVIATPGDEDSWAFNASHPQTVHSARIPRARDITSTDFWDALSEMQCVSCSEETGLGTHLIAILVQRGGQGVLEHRAAARAGQKQLQPLGGFADTQRCKSLTTPPPPFPLEPHEPKQHLCTSSLQSCRILSIAQPQYS